MEVPQYKKQKITEEIRKRALKFIEENTKYRYVRGIGLDGCLSRSGPDKEYYVEPWVAREAVEIALGER